MIRLKTIFAFWILLMCCSCQDYLDLRPKNKVVVESLKDARTMMKTYQYSMVSAPYYMVNYNGMNLSFPFDRDVNFEFAMLSDNLNMATFMAMGHFIESSLGAYYEEVNWKTMGLGMRLWDNLYKHVGFFNTLITSLDKYKEADNQEWQQAMGEAKFLRSFYLFKLLQYFSPYHSAELGIPVNLDPEVITPVERKSQPDVFKIILSELDEIKNYTSKQEWNIFFSAASVNALLAQVYMYKAESASKDPDDWKNAAYYGSELLKTHQVEGREELRMLFMTTKTAGYYSKTFALMNFGYTRNQWTNAYAPWGTLPTLHKPANNFGILFKPEDIRSEVFVGVGYDGMEIYKWLYNFDVKDHAVMLRVSDILLITAEAYARLGENDKAIELLEKLLENRIQRYEGYSGTNLLQDILKERRIELCYEYDSRWIDMKRLGLECTRQGLNEKGQAAEYSIEANDYRYTMPIPMDSELLYNKIEQNPGW